MKLARKAVLVYSTYIVGVIVVGGAALTSMGQGAAIVALLVWFVAFVIAGFALLQCPYCHKAAIKTPAGAYVPWVGARCRYCRRAY